MSLNDPAGRKVWGSRLHGPWVWIALVGLIASFILGIAVRWNRTGSLDGRRLPPVVGSPAPAFELPLLSGGRQKLGDLKGKAVLINFWATWCPPCKEEMPLLQAYQQKYAGRLVVLGIDSQEEQAVAQAFIQERNFTFPILLDQDGRVTDSYYAKNFPTSFFVDDQGVLRAQHVGQLTEDLLVQYLKTIGF